jgi:hypothetical protein
LFVGLYCDDWKFSEKKRSSVTTNSKGTTHSCTEFKRILQQKQETRKPTLFQCSDSSSSTLVRSTYVLFQGAPESHDGNYGKEEVVQVMKESKSYTLPSGPLLSWHPPSNDSVEFPFIVTYSMRFIGEVAWRPLINGQGGGATGEDFI